MDNYLSWSAALEIGITSRGRLSYITGDKPAPLKSDPQWETWALEDSQVKVWIISSVSSNIQPLILRKPTSFDMWTVLAKMYGRKKRHLRTYQIKQSIYSLTQGDLSVAAYYAALTTKWEELDYHVTDEWKCGSDHSLHWEKEWMDRTFLFLGGLRDEFEPIRSQILNGDEIPGIEEVYARVESEEQRRQVMHLTTGSVPSAFVSRASGTGQRPARHCTHCNKLGHSADFCWDLHPEKRLVRGRPPSGRRNPSLSDSSQGTPSSGVKTTKLSPDQLKELQVYIGRLSTTPEESSTKEKATVEDVVEEDRTNPNPAISLDDPSPSNEDLPIALRKGTRQTSLARIAKASSASLGVLTSMSEISLRRMRRGSQFFSYRSADELPTSFSKKKWGFLAFQRARWRIRRAEDKKNGDFLHSDEFDAEELQTIQIHKGGVEFDAGELQSTLIHEEGVLGFLPHAYTKPNVCPKHDHAHAKSLN
ncbi:hypothetical protein EJ110_NYTH21388 [Nymphaea thermarum]|nr:hypothetical protein EJ110_NYTH21388 [Nymphaea thermarum]